jgi:hypothetical protein
MDGTISFGDEAFSCARWSLIRVPFQLHSFPSTKFPAARSAGG